MVQIVIVGGESSGKSSLLQAFLQFPASFCQAGTGTRCPVEYTLKHNATCDGEVPRVWVSDGQSPLVEVKI
jgi:nicotinamide riboside kinase